MVKIIWVVIVGVILLGLAWYLIAPAFETIESDDVSPLDVRDALDAMDAATLAEFEEQVEQMADVVVEMDDAMEGEAQLLAMGDFMDRAHHVEGKALLIEDDGKKILRFEDFETINGPNLHIYLSSDLGADDFIDLGKIKATKGNVNYELPDDVDLDRYDKVLVWCVPFRVLFSYADLG